MTHPLIEARSLCKQFKIGSKAFQAVSSFNLSLYPGEIVGLAGESGSGKSTVGKLLLGLLEASSGSIYFEGKDINTFSSSEKLAFRRQAQMIFQNPYTSLNPCLTVEEMLGEALDIHKLAKGQAKKERLVELMESVGLHPHYLKRYPQAFSGGQRQRIGIARALAVDPRLVICDEPLSALDISIQAQIVELLKRLQQERQLTYLFISHDLMAMHYLAHRMGVIYQGQLVELGPSETVYHRPQHPYTQLLRSSVLEIDSPKREPALIKTTPDPSYKGSSQIGCSFANRCPFAEPICQKVTPDWIEVAPQHFAACHRLNQIEGPKYCPKN